MEKKEFDATQRQEKEIKNQSLTKNLTILNTVLILFFGYFNCIATQQVETKVDFRYFNSTKSLEGINNVRINTYDGVAYNTKEAYDAAIAQNPKYKKRNLVQKWFKALSKGQ